MQNALSPEQLALDNAQSPQQDMGLFWVRQEIGHTMGRIREWLALWNQQPRQTLPLQHALVESQQVRGALEVAQCYAPALLMGEIRTNIQELLIGRLQAQEGAVAILQEGLALLERYLDTAPQQGIDSVLLLTNPLNELRRLRGAAALHESAWFSEQLIGWGGKMPQTRETIGIQTIQLLARYLPLAQSSFVRWKADPNDEQALRMQGSVMDVFSTNLPSQGGFQLTRFYAAVVEALLMGGVYAEYELTQLFERTINVLHHPQSEDGDAVRGGLLYYIGRSRKTGPRGDALKQLWPMARFIPNEATLQQMRARLSHSYAQELQQNATLLAEQLRTAQQELEQWVHQNALHSSIKPEQIHQRLQSVCVALGQLGLNTLQYDLSRLVKVISDTTQKQERDENIWLPIAAQLVDLENQILKAIRDQLWPVQTITDTDKNGMNLGKPAVAREALANYTRARHVIHQYLLRGNPDDLPNAVQQLREMTAALEFMGETVASEGCTQMVNAILEMGQRKPDETQRQKWGEPLAESLTALEMHLDALSQNQSSPWLAQFTAALGRLSVVLHGAVTLPTEIDAAPETTPAAVALSEEQIELREIFLEESEELIKNLEEHLAVWQQRPQDADQARRGCLRVLHTLKGSARLTGVWDMGNLSHELETQLDQGQADVARLVQGITELRALQNNVLPQVTDKTVEVAATMPLHTPAQTAETPTTGFNIQKNTSTTSENINQNNIQAVADNTPKTEAQPTEPANVAPVRTEAHQERQGDQSSTEGGMDDAQLTELLGRTEQVSQTRWQLEQQQTRLNQHLREFNQAIARLNTHLTQEQTELTELLTPPSYTPEASAPRYWLPAQADSAASSARLLPPERAQRVRELHASIQETLADLGSLHEMMNDVNQSNQNLLLEQARAGATLHQGLREALQVPFARYVPRLQRLVQQTCLECRKQCQVVFSGADMAMDREVLEQVLPALEHLLRNAITHGIEVPAERTARGKDPEGQIQINIVRQGGQFLMTIRDNGSGLDLPAIRREAERRGLLRGVTNRSLTEHELAQFIFAPRFSTASEITQSAGRGIGLDVVSAQLKRLRGTIDVQTQSGEGTRFTLRLPTPQALNQILVIRLGNQKFGIPLTAIDSVARVTAADLAHVKDGVLNLANTPHQLLRLNELLGLSIPLATDTPYWPALLIRHQNQRIALLADQVLANKELEVRPVGAQLASIPGVIGAALLQDGKIILILDPANLIQNRERQHLTQNLTTQPPVETPADVRPLVMVVDDSLTVRRFNERVLQKAGYRTMTAEDGMDALDKLRHAQPNLCLLDIEMPRLDGLELAHCIRNNDRLKHTPIIMLTSRTNQQHRLRAEQVGVNRYLVKPCQEDLLLHEVRQLLAQKANVMGLG